MLRGLHSCCTSLLHLGLTPWNVWNSGWCWSKTCGEPAPIEWSRAQLLCAGQSHGGGGAEIGWSLLACWEMQEPEPALTGVPTPILDSGVLPSRARKTRRVNVIVGFLGGIAAGGLLIVVGRQANSHMDPAVDFLSFSFVLAIAVIVPELGHLLTGWAVGFRFSSIQVGPVSLRIEHGILKARFRLEMAAMEILTRKAQGIAVLSERI
jgi:hypothetical protein